MKLAILICMILLIGAGCMCTASGAQAASTRGPVLDDAKCQTIWTMASPNGATISKDKALPYVIDFTVVYTNNDGAIDANEFKVGCQGGWVKRPHGCSCGTSCIDGVCYCMPCP
jgi:hypothetical protein